MQAQLEAGRPAEALEIAKAARVRFPDDLRLLGLEADAWLKAGDRTRAVALHEGAIERHGDDPEAHVAFAGLLLEARDFAGAERVLEAAGLRFPGAIAIPFQLGAVLEEQQRDDEAERAFRRALALDARHGPTLNYLGYMLADRGQRLDEAVELPAAGARAGPLQRVVPRLARLGLLQAGRAAAARASTWLRAGEQLPANSVVQDHVGDVLFALRDRTGAIAAWQRALAGDGRSIEKRDILQKIERARTRE